MGVIKEYQQSQITMRGPGAWDAKPVNTGYTCILRTDDGRKLNGKALGAIFNEVSKDFPNVEAANVVINARENRVEVTAVPPAGYKGLQPKITGARG